MHKLRHHLAGYLESDRRNVAFAHDRPHWIDVQAFARQIAAAGDIQALAEATALYQEEFLQGLHLDDAPGFEAWLTAQQEHYRLLLLDALEQLAHRYQRQRRWSAAERELRRLLAMEPWRERSHRQLMMVLDRQGDHAAALAQYEHCRQLLASNLSVEPTRETKRLLERIKRRRNQGPDNLPLPSTPLFGREEELDALHQRLLNPNCRLLTVAGLGGVGKTSLAVEAARQAATVFFDGVAFISLAGIASADYLASSVADAIGCPLRGQTDERGQLIDFLRPREMLLLLDNYEHLLPEVVLVKEILASTPDVKLLVTSREQLWLQQEWLFPLDVLSHLQRGVYRRGARGIGRGRAQPRGAPLSLSHPPPGAGLRGRRAEAAGHRPPVRRRRPPPFGC
ncbi:MAG: BTAD domain-containing putative transcriptional regulator [Candidatus Promineifilaceae bacterium]|nr:BTAD domain-containing putative transcriptional regulator [Candidatus Promineifilaceae bacterium]